MKGEVPLFDRKYMRELQQINDEKFGEIREQRKREVQRIIEESIIDPEEKPAPMPEVENKGVMQSDSFDVEEILKVNDQLQQEEHERRNMEARKELDLPFYENPKNDNELLINYQYDYLKNNSEAAWGKIIELSFTVTENLVHEFMGKYKIRIDRIEKEERISIAVFYVLRRYRTRVGYYIKNFVAALRCGVQHSMLYITKMDEETVYIDDVFPYAKQDRLGENDNSIGEFE